MVKRSTSSGFNRQAWLRFDLSSLPAAVASAKLRVYGRLTGAADAGVGVRVYTSAATAWSEAGLTFATRPAVGTAPAATFAVTSTTGGSRST